MPVFVMKVLILPMLLSICCGSNMPDDELISIASCLPQDFRISELLRLKLSLDKMAAFDDTSTCETTNRCVKGDAKWVNSGIKPETPVHRTASVKSQDSDAKPAAMALIAHKRDYDTDAAAVDWHPSWHREEKPSKLETLFQISITALAFLSFGGYLLCLIVQAIKSKGTTYFHPVATATTTTNSGVKRIKIYRRSRRYAEAGLTRDQRVNLGIAYDHRYDGYSDVENEDQLAFPTPMDLSTTLFSFTENHVKI